MGNIILIQILGIITLGFFIVSLQQQKKENYLLLQIGGTLLFIAQYILTNKITGAITFTISAIRGLVFYYYKKKNLKPSPTVLVVFQIALAVSTFFTWQNIFSLIPFLATAVKTWSTWQDDMKWIRRTSLFAQGCMIVYNLSASMYTGAITEACNLTSTAIAMWRYDFHKEKFRRKNKKRRG